MSSYKSTALSFYMHLYNQAGATATTNINNLFFVKLADLFVSDLETTQGTRINYCLLGFVADRM